MLCGFLAKRTNWASDEAILLLLFLTAGQKAFTVQVGYGCICGGGSFSVMNSVLEWQLPDDAVD